MALLLLSLRQEPHRLLAQIGGHGIGGAQGPLGVTARGVLNRFGGGASTLNQLVGLDTGLLGHSRLGGEPALPVGEFLGAGIDRRCFRPGGVDHLLGLLLGDPPHLQGPLLGCGHDGAGVDTSLRDLPLMRLDLRQPVFRLPAHRLDLFRAHRLALRRGGRLLDDGGRFGLGFLDELGGPFLCPGEQRLIVTRRGQLLIGLGGDGRGPMLGVSPQTGHFLLGRLDGQAFLLGGFDDGFGRFLGLAQDPGCLLAGLAP